MVGRWRYLGWATPATRGFRDGAADGSGRAADCAGDVQEHVGRVRTAWCRSWSLEVGNVGDDHGRPQTSPGLSVSSPTLRTEPFGHSRPSSVTSNFTKGSVLQVAPRRLTPKQAERKNKQAIQKYNSEVRKYNSAVKKNNSEVKRYQRAQSAQNRRLKSAIASYNADVRRANSKRTIRVELRESTRVLCDQFGRIEEDVDEIFGEFAAEEAANSVEALRIFEEEPEKGEDDFSHLRVTSIGDELSLVSDDLNNRWQGAIFALNPSNPDAARHFCTSAREVIVSMLDGGAPDKVVLQEWPDCSKTPSGAVQRRSKIEFLLRRKGIDEGDIVQFVDDDVDDVMNLFGEFNPATHGKAGRYDLMKLGAMKVRVESAIRFLSYLIDASS